MKKGLTLIVIILIIPISLALTFFDDFNFSSNWIPQYYQRMNITQINKNNVLMLDSLSPFNGDRDIHAELNKTVTQSLISIDFDYDVLKCNSSWKSIEGISPQGASIYIFYNNSQNFISIEFKINANSTYCGSGIAQIAAFKRMNGISESLINYTTYNFEMNQTYHPQVTLKDTDLQIFLDNLLLATSQIPGDLKNGSILLENAGTMTAFDNFFLNLSNPETNTTSINPIENQTQNNSQNSANTSNPILPPSDQNPSNTSSIINNSKSSNAASPKTNSTPKNSANLTKETPKKRYSGITGKVIDAYTNPENNTVIYLSFIPLIILIIAMIVFLIKKKNFPEQARQE